MWTHSVVNAYISKMIPLSFQGSHFLYYYFLLPPPSPPLSFLLPPKTLSPFTSSHSSYFFNFEHPSPYNIPCTLSSLLIPRTISLLKHACFSSHLPISFLSHPFSLSSYYPQLSSPETSFHPLPWVSRISTVPVVRLLSPIMENFPNFITLVEEGG